MPELDFRVDHEDCRVDSGVDGFVPFDPAVTVWLLDIVEDPEERHLGEAHLGRCRRLGWDALVSVDPFLPRRHEVHAPFVQGPKILVLLASQGMGVDGRRWQESGGVAARLGQGQQVEQVICGLVPVGQVAGPEQALDGGEHRRVVVLGVIDDTARDERGDHQRRR